MSNKNASNQTNAGYVPEEPSVTDAIKQLSGRLLVLEQFIQQRDVVVAGLIHRVEEKTNRDWRPTPMPWEPPAWMTHTLYGRMPELSTESESYSDTMISIGSIKELARIQTLLHWIEQMDAALNGYSFEKLGLLQTDLDKIKALQNLVAHQEQFMAPNVYAAFYYANLQSKYVRLRSNISPALGVKLEHLFAGLEEFRIKTFPQLKYQVMFSQQSGSLAGFQMMTGEIKGLVTVIRTVLGDEVLMRQLQTVIV